MSQAAARKRELLKPPEVKPVLTLMLMLACLFFVGDPGKGWAYSLWCSDHSFMAQKFFSSIDKHDIVGILSMTFQATAAQLSPLAFIFDAGLWWIFSNVVEKKLVAWRYPLFVFIGMLGNWAILAYGIGYVEPSQRFIGPYMFMFYVLGAYLIFKPKKPFKPAQWKSVPWKLFKGDADHGVVKALRMPFVNPWIYVSIFLVYTAMIYFFLSLSNHDLVNMTHVGFVGLIQRSFVGTIQAGSMQILRPIQAVESCLLGVFTGYILVNIVVKSKMKRDAGDLQVQAILQYKELRALDMNHKQAVEGTAKLIGVPLDITRDWIAKGLQMPPPADS